MIRTQTVSTCSDDLNKQGWWCTHLVGSCLLSHLHTTWPRLCKVDGTVCFREVKELSVLLLERWVLSVFINLTNNSFSFNAPHLPVNPVWLTFGLRPRLPLTFLNDFTGFLLFERSSCFSGTDAWLSTFTRPPLFFERSSGWIRGRTPPLDMVTPRRSCGIKHFRNKDFDHVLSYNTE